MSAAAFYCVADERYFLGAVAVLNSLRIHGHRDPLHVLDCGMAGDQRELLAPHAEIHRAPAGVPPWLAKTAAPLESPSEVTVLIDTDMIVTRPLGELVAAAADGVVTFENDTHRFVPEWGELLDLGTARPGPYVSSGLIALGGSPGRELLELLDDRQRCVEMDKTIFGAGPAGYPFRFPEQDVLNAILRTRIDPERVTVLPHDLAPTPPFPGVRLRDLRAVRCSYGDGREPFVLHHFHRKPWLVPMRHGLYSRLLVRLWRGDDVALRVPEAMLPRHMRSGVRARVERLRIDLVDGVSRRVLGREGTRA